MSIAGAYRTALRRHHRMERRSRKRVVRDNILWVAGVCGWCALFLTLGWLVFAGFYGLLVTA